MPTYKDFPGTVATLADLKAIEGELLRKDGAIFFVASPGTNEPPAPYMLLKNSVLTALGNIIVAPDDGVDRWIKMDNRVHYASVAPSAAPPLKGIIWIANLSTPTRTVTWLSTGIAGVSDWTPYGNTPFDYGSDPTSLFTPDYVHQLAWDGSTTLYIADGATNVDWLPVAAGGGGGGS